MPEVVRNDVSAQLDVRKATMHFGRLNELLAFLRHGKAIDEKYLPVFSSCAEMLSEAICCHTNDLSAVSRTNLGELRRWLRADKVFGIARYQSDKATGAAELERLKYQLENIGRDECQEDEALDWAIQLVKEIRKQAQSAWHSEIESRSAV